MRQILLTRQINFMRIFIHLMTEHISSSFFSKYVTFYDISSFVRVKEKNEHAFENFLFCRREEKKTFFFFLFAFFILSCHFCFFTDSIMYSPTYIRLLVTFSYTDKPRKKNEIRERLTSILFFRKLYYSIHLFHLFVRQVDL